jgi:hypothetical protein
MYLNLLRLVPDDQNLKWLLYLCHIARILTGNEPMLTLRLEKWPPIPEPLSFFVFRSNIIFIDSEEKNHLNVHYKLYTELIIAPTEGTIKCAG